MNNNNLKIKETFASALQNHQRKNFKVAESLYKEILKTKPNHFESVFYLGALLVQTKNFDQAQQLKCVDLLRFWEDQTMRRQAKPCNAAPHLDEQYPDTFQQVQL